MASAAFVRALSSNTVTQHHHNDTGASLKLFFQQQSRLSRHLLSRALSAGGDGTFLSDHMVSGSLLASSFPLWETRTCKNFQLRSTVTEEASSAEEESVINNSSKCVLVVGATGGVGQLVIAALLDRGIKIRAILRNHEKATTLFGEKNMKKIEVIMGDTRDMKKLNASDFQGVTHVICCTGTTAFPSKRWDGDNTPENTDWHGVRNLIDILPRTLERFVLVSSVGVTKFNELPWNIMNIFGVLKYKKMGEDYLRESGIPYTIIRPGRLTDGPYTSYDLNTLLKATAGTRRAVIVGQGDKLVGEASRIVVAEACVQALDIDCTCGNTYEINSVEGDGPGKDKECWEELFKKAHSGATV